MRYLIILIIILASLLPYSAPSVAQDTITRVDKIRYCRTIWPICNDKLQADYHWWEDHGVPDQIQKNTYISRYVEPSRSRVKHVVFLASGQRWGDIDDNLITGQRDEDAFRKQDATRNLAVSANSLAYRLFEEDIYSASNTFAGLAFDARFNWGFSNDNKRDIVNAYFSWLKSKFYSGNLESVYLAGHSRGGALVLRLAEKFQQEFPNVAVIVHTFDPVPNKSRGELGAYNSSIDNPVAGYPRDTALLDNKGNWGWKSNFRTYYGNKKHFSVFNMMIGGKIFGFAQETRAVTINTGTGEEEDLGWYFQRWYDMPSLGFQASNAGGHDPIGRSHRTVNDALEHVEDRRNVFLNNIAPSATASASSTFCSSPGLHCYSASRINDRDLDTRVGGYYSWANSRNSSTEWVKLRWPDLINTNYLEIFTSENYPIRDYRIEYLDGSTWRTLLSRFGNTQLHIRHTFANIQTREIRLVGVNGPTNQSAYRRVNEIIVVGDWVNPPNRAPVARCTASPNEGVSSVLSTLNGTGSYDTDGTINSYRWDISDGTVAFGSEVTHRFTADPGITEFFTARLTVTDNDGAKSSTSCLIIVYCESGGLQPLDQEELLLQDCAIR